LIHQGGESYGKLSNLFSQILSEIFSALNFEDLVAESGAERHSKLSGPRSGSCETGRLSTGLLLFRGKTFPWYSELFTEQCSWYAYQQDTKKIRKMLWL